MNNEDDMCFTWCVLRALNPVDKNSERIDKSLKGHEDLLNMNDRFERQNATISVNVFGYENKDVYPLRISKHEHNTCVNLLLIDDGEKQHYCLIKSMSRLCLNSFNSEKSLGKHKEYCDSNDAVKIEMLEEGSTLKFKHFSIPFIVYADFESFTQKLVTAQPNPDESYTKQYQKHTPSGFCYYIKCFDEEVYKMINLKQNPIIYTKQTGDEDDIVYRDIKELENPISDAIDIGEFDFLKKLIDEQNELKTLLANLESKYEGEHLSLAQSAQRFALIIRKGVYPYDYVDGLEKLAETQLPPKEEFYSKLSGDNISDEDYVHAQKVWKEFECKTKRDYHNLYLTSDVLLLADVFETFRDYYTAPGLAWDAALKLTEVELELISDPDMLLMIEKGIRGGVSTNITRYGKARYLDANNLYGWAMSKPLPTTVHMKKTKIRFNKPVYLGMCILDLSKTLMYDFHYNYIKNNYGDKAKLLLTDTDSLAYEIKTEDFYTDISPDVNDMFDTSNFPANHPSGFKSGVNKKVVGMFKDECGGKIMHEFVGLRAKLYSYRMYEGNEEKRCKGVKQSVVKTEISFDDYKTCLFSRKEQLRKMNVIRSRGHQIFTEEVNKIALSANDDKRVIQEDGVHTLAYGHWRL
ncbi:hypothetical protein MAR_023414 [Mya arenaria]|uniref:DNA-directed DNA polymerase n=1 Tax=Mya arenaria TaxID=6604 RepID=A0ABY7DQ58_MYAAR|nr:hypothetical protein MAR_023414 [Mya arenaria]